MIGRSSEENEDPSGSRGQAGGGEEVVSSLWSTTSRGRCPEKEYAEVGRRMKVGGLSWETKLGSDQKGTTAERSICNRIYTVVYSGTEPYSVGANRRSPIILLLFSPNSALSLPSYGIL
jgi:hypothetical protein